LIAGTVGSNPAEVMDICLLYSVQLANSTTM